MKRSRRRAHKKAKTHTRPTSPAVTAIGRVDKNSRGFAFITPEGKGQLRDLFVLPHQARYLFTGDRVSFRVVRSRGRPVAQVQNIVKRAVTEIVGRVERSGRGLLTPGGDYYAFETPPASTRAGDWVLGRIEHYPSPKGPGTVTLEDRLGSELLPRHDYRIAASLFGLRTRFDRAALDEAERLRPVAEAEMAKAGRTGRRDLTHLPFVTIDGEDAKDFDDAVYVETHSGEAAFRLYVAIADVSFFVRPGNALDREALERGTSVYFPGIAIPMLPERLSNDLCSLRPREPKLAVVAEIPFTAHGDPLAPRFYEAVIQTVRRLTYEEVHRFAEGGEPAEPKLAPLKEPLQRLASLYRRLARKRLERGALDFELGEAKIVVDDEGNPLSSGKAPRYESHRWIEEFMIAANRAVAMALREAKIPSIFRVHEPPDPLSLQELNLMLKAFGVSVRLESVSPRDFARVLEATRKVKGAAALHHAILRSQRQACYEALPKGHFGLALRDYAHFTSPIRRYPDLVTHRALKRLIHTGTAADREGKGQSLESIAARNSDAERKAVEAERWAVRRKQCRFLKGREGEEFSGAISGVTEKGLYVELNPIAIEGFIPVDTLEGSYTFDEKRHALRKGGKERLGIGDTLRVRLVRVALEENAIELERA